MSKIRIRPWRLLTVAIVGLFLIWQGVGWVSDQIASLLVRTVAAQRGYVEVIVEGEGVLARTEELIPAPFDGRVVFLVQNGQAVRTGQLIAEIAEIVDPGVRVRLAELDRELVEFDRDWEERLRRYQQERDALSNQIAAATAELNHALTTGRHDLVQEWNQRLEQLRAQREQLDAAFQAEQSARQAERDALVAARDALTVGVIGQRWMVRVDRPGEVYFSFDGWEGVLQPPAAPDWDALREVSWQRHADGTVAVTGQPLFRLVQPFEAYAYVRLHEFAPLQHGQRVSLRSPALGGAGVVPATVESIDNRVDGIGVWLRLDAYRSEWAELRYLGGVTLVLESYQGVKVPREALYLDGDRYGVFILMEDRPVFRRVEVVGGNADEVVVTGIPSDVQVVLDPARVARRV